MDDSSLASTRRALHAAAELVLAGPQYRASRTIKLRVVAGGFGTWSAPDVRVEHGKVVAGGRRIDLAGTAESIGAALDLDVGAPEGVYPDGSGVEPDEPLRIDVASAEQIVSAFVIGDAALRELAGDQEPVLWPEHFDVAIRADEVNYGVSPGDTFHDQPYAYVGVDPVPDGAFWNAPFGVTRPIADLGGADALLAFFREAQQRHGRRA